MISLTKNLETGNDLIDTQHRELIDRVNRLTEAGRIGKEKIAAIKTLDFLLDYTELHFLAEEKLQEESHYPKLDLHRGQHAQFRKAIDQLRQMLEEEEGPSEAFVVALKKNVADWLVNHIKVWDLELACFLRGQGE